MKSKEYLEIRRRQDALLAEINDNTPVDDPRIGELLSLQKECDGFERSTFHRMGYQEISLDLDLRILIRTIRMAHEYGMNLSDYVGMLIWRDLGDDSLDFRWTTDLRDRGDLDLSGSWLPPVPEPVVERLGWQTGDFVRITSSKEGLAFTGFEFDDEYR